MKKGSRGSRTAPHRRWRTALDLEGGAAGPIAWTPAAPEADLARLAPWRAAVGPVRRGGAPVRPAQWPVTVAAWNLHVGGGAIGAFWRHLVGLAAHGADQLGAVRPVVVLLQEAFASGPPIPSPRASTTGARRIAPDPRGEPRADIVSFARREGLSLLYVPSMRNGGVGREDRGNAIVANVPLRACRAIELPFERQRRVAVAARVVVGCAAIDFCSVHLENRSPWRKVLRTLGAARARQMVGLLAALAPRGACPEPEVPAVLGGDFNTWVAGRREPAWRAAREQFPDPSSPDPRPTHHHELGGWLRPSDHLMFRVPGGWHAESRRLDDTFGSDHYPLVGTMGPPEFRPRSME